jgi:hypothetical protein
MSSDCFVGNLWLCGELAVQRALAAVNFLPCRADSINKSMLQWTASLLLLISAHNLYFTYDKNCYKPQLTLIPVLKLSKFCWPSSCTTIPTKSHLTSQEVPYNYLRPTCAPTTYISVYFMFCWPNIIVYQYNETKVMHFLFNLLRFKGLYMFWALLADPQEVLHKRHLV